ncbi:unnamed protein product [Soboliphyme baturini]|uniref:NopRA1 domain-containing protein n=1 Tax=Soboliphyme baturini TaxID=241478 RepID=A0A183J5P5_9BILA|nr:unnamed protein product [Soboliphyme baturini]
MIGLVSQKGFQISAYFVCRTLVSMRHASTEEVKAPDAVINLLSFLNSEDSIYKLSAMKGISKMDAIKICNHRISVGPLSDVSELSELLGKSPEMIEKIANARFEPAFSFSDTSPDAKKKKLMRMCSPVPKQDHAKRWTRVLSYRFNALHFSWLVMERNFSVVDWGRKVLFPNDDPHNVGTGGSQLKLRSVFIHDLVRSLISTIVDFDCVVKEKLSFLAIVDSSKSLKYQILLAMLEQAFCSATFSRLKPWLAEPDENCEDKKKTGIKKRTASKNDTTQLWPMFEFDFQLINQLFGLKASKRSRFISRSCISSLLSPEISQSPFPVCTVPVKYQEFIDRLKNVELHTEGAAFLQAFAFCYLFGDSYAKLTNS